MMTVFVQTGHKLTLRVCSARWFRITDYALNDKPVHAIQYRTIRLILSGDDKEQDELAQEEHGDTEDHNENDSGDIAISDRALGEDGEDQDFVPMIGTLDTASGEGGEIVVHDVGGRRRGGGGAVAGASTNKKNKADEYDEGEDIEDDEDEVDNNDGESEDAENQHEDSAQPLDTQSPAQALVLTQEATGQNDGDEIAPVPKRRGKLSYFPARTGTIKTQKSHSDASDHNTSLILQSTRVENPRRASSKKRSANAMRSRTASSGAGSTNTLFLALVLLVVRKVKAEILYVNNLRYRTTQLSIRDKNRCS